MPKIQLFPHENLKIYDTWRKQVLSSPLWGGGGLPMRTGAGAAAPCGWENVGVLMTTEPLLGELFTSTALEWEQGGLLQNPSATGRPDPGSAHLASKHPEPRMRRSPCAFFLVVRDERVAECGCRCIKRPSTRGLFHSAHR